MLLECQKVIYIYLFLYMLEEFLSNYIKLRYTQIGQLKFAKKIDFRVDFSNV